MVFEDNDHICFLVIKYVSYLNDFLCLFKYHL